jgi:ABC-type transport system substrate-binding protein
MLIVTPIFLVERTDNAIAEPSSSIRIGLVGEIDPLNPNDSINQNTRTIIPHIFESLITMDESMTPRPLLANSWETTPDGKGLIFHLRKGVRFHDGTPFNARAVKITFDRMMNEKLKVYSMFASFLKSVEILDESTVKMNLNGGPGPALAVLPIRGQIESPAAIEKYGKDIGFHPIGTGPYKFVEWVPDQRVVLEANKDYWGGSPKISQVVFKPVSEEQTRLSMLEAEDLDVAMRPSYAEVKRLKSLPGIRIEDRISGELLFVVFNCVKEPFNDKRVRQAISYGIDRKGIVNTLLFGGVRLAETYAAPIVKHIVKYDIYPYNPEKAKTILAGSGWKLGKSGFLEKNEEIFKTAIVTPFGRYPMDRQIAEAIQAQLKKIGIDVKIIVVESGAFIKTINSGREVKQSAEYGMMIISRPMGPDPDTAFTQHFHSASIPPKAPNSSIFGNKELDSLLEEGANTADEIKRGVIYKKAQNILNEEIPWLPIYSYVDYLALRKGVRGVGYPSTFATLFVSKEAELVP